MPSVGLCLPLDRHHTKRRITHWGYFTVSSGALIRHYKFIKQQQHQQQPLFTSSAYPVFPQSKNSLYFSHPDFLLPHLNRSLRRSVASETPPPASFPLEADKRTTSSRWCHLSWRNKVSLLEPEGARKSWNHVMTFGVRKPKKTSKQTNQTSGVWIEMLEDEKNVHSLVEVFH